MAETIAIATLTKIVQKALDHLFASAPEAAVKWWKEHQNESIADKLGESIRRMDRVKTLLHAADGVKLSSIYFPSRLEYAPGVAARVDKLSELPPSKSYIVEGTVGQGKSFFLRYMTLVQLREAAERIPIFLELRNLRPDLNLQTLIFEAFRGYGLYVDREFFEFYARSGRFVLLLDAFDEILPSEVGRSAETLEGFARSFPNLQIVLTSRPDSALHLSPWFTVVKLAPLAPRDHLKFLEKLLGEDKDRAQEIAKALRRSKQIEAIMTTPLLLTLLALVYNSDLSVPANEVEFYRRLFDLLLYRHDATKPGYRRLRYTKLGDQEILELFSAFCFFTRQAKLSEFSADEFYETLERAKRYTDKTVKSEKFKDEIVRVACLLLEEGFSLHFIHKSVQEFYAAVFLVNSPEKIAKEFYLAMIGGAWTEWRQEMRFLSIIDSYRYSLFFLRWEMEKFVEILTLKPTGNVLMSSYESVELAYRQIVIGLDLGLTTKSMVTSKMLEDWSPCRELAFYGPSSSALSVNYVFHLLRGSLGARLLKYLNTEIPLEGKRHLSKFAERAKITSAYASDSVSVNAYHLLKETEQVEIGRRILDEQIRKVSSMSRKAEKLIRTRDSRLEIIRDV